MSLHVLHVIICLCWYILSNCGPYMHHICSAKSCSCRQMANEASLILTSPATAHLVPSPPTATDNCEIHTCPPCPSATVSYVQKALRAMQVRHARVHPAQHLCAGSSLRYTGDTRMCPPCVPAAPHLCADSTSRYAGETRTLARVRPASHRLCGLWAGSALHNAGRTRTCPTCLTPMRQ
jgi:hypothetical protein